MAPLARQIAGHFSYNDYLQWEEGRWEIIDGVVYDMTPAPSREHQRISGDLFVQLYQLLRGGMREVYTAPFDVRFPDGDETSDAKVFTVVQPDIVVVCDQEKLDDRGCVGAPDLVVEILSPSTAAKDLKIKRDLYEKHGVKEYWLVHPSDKTVMIYHLEEDGQYRKAAVFSGSDVIVSTSVDGLSVILEDIFGKIVTGKSIPPV